MKTKIEISPDMTAFVGAGIVEEAGGPAGAIALGYRLGEGTVSVDPAPVDREALEDADVVLLVTPAACERLFGWRPRDSSDWYLPSDIRLVALAVVDCELQGAAQITLRGAKCIELLCTTCGQLAGDGLIAVDGTRDLSEGEARQIIAARTMIDERWNEKLTLSVIARACGLNRAKLTSGFRSMFDCSVTDAIAERRLGGARQMLLSTNLPVASVGYACGYSNNASFSRAFSRRFGLPPTRLRSVA